MANHSRNRKRVHACPFPRALDGSAFMKCDQCGVSVAIALYDMHRCDGKPLKDVKRFRGVTHRHDIVVNQSFSDQPKSPFRFFMDDFMANVKTNDPIDIDRKGFDTWRNMSIEGREPYVIKAKEVDAIHYRKLIQEMNSISKVDDEADSTMVRKFDKLQENFKLDEDDNDNLDDSPSRRYFESFSTWEWEMEHAWIADTSL